MSQIEESVDPVLKVGLELLKDDRNKMWGMPTLAGDRKLLSAIRQTSLKDIVEPRGHNSIAFFSIWRRGARKVCDIGRAEVNSLRRHIHPHKLSKVDTAVGLNLGPNDPSFNDSYYTGKLHKSLGSLTSKEIRSCRECDTSITDFKLGINLTEIESRSWSSRLASLTSTRHKNTLLRIVHGDVYTQSKLFRFGMSDTNVCPRCNEIEDLKHKFVECAYVKLIWQKAKPFIIKLQDVNHQNDDTAKTSVAANLGSNTISMTYTAEILQTILYLKPDQSYLMHPGYIAKRALKNLTIKEGNSKRKRAFIELLNETNRD